MKKAIQIAALLSLMAAYVFGLISQKNEISQILQEHFPKTPLKQTGTEYSGYTTTNKTQTSVFLYPAEANGWGGPMTVCPVINEAGVIEEVLVPVHRETPAFFNYLKANGYLTQFRQKSITDSLELGKDIDAVTGATISSRAVAKAVRESVRRTAEEKFNLSIPKESTQWSFGLKEVLLILLYGITILGVALKIKKARLPVLFVSLGFLGLYTNSPISLANLTSLMLGFLPPIQDHFFWWWLIPGTVILLLLLGKNFYCTWLCPFGAMQEFISKTGGARFSIPRSLQTYLKTTIYIFIWLALLLSFISRNPSIAAYEPFSTLFGLKGLAVQWYLVSFAVIGSFLVPRFWCRFFCPVGEVLNLLLKTRRYIRNRFFQPSTKEKICHE